MSPENPALWTPNNLHLAGRILSVHCPKCSVLRDVDLRGLVARRGDQPVGAMRFKCHKCGAAGTAFVSWRDQTNALCSYDYANGQRRGPW